MTSSKPISSGSDFNRYILYRYGHIILRKLHFHQCKFVDMISQYKMNLNTLGKVWRAQASIPREHMDNESNIEEDPFHQSRCN